MTHLYICKKKLFLMKVYIRDIKTEKALPHNNPM